MATREDIEAPLTLEIDGTVVTSDAFARGVQAFFNALRELSEAVPGGEQARWAVQVKKGSNLIGVFPQSATPPEVVERVVGALSGGVSLLEQEARAPKFFNDSVLKNIRSLARITSTSEADDTVIRIWADQTALPVTHRSVVHVSEILEGIYEEHGSIQGKMQTLSERGGFKFVVYEPIWDRAVQCHVPEHLKDDALAAFGHRVEVYGPVRYRRDGSPTSVDVEFIEQLPERDKLPSYRDVRGILRNL